jgi:cell volume regulation protein A
VLGYASSWIINRLRSDNEFLYPVMMISCVFFTFTLTEMVGGNSYLAVYIAGLVMGNRKMAVKRTIKTFFGGFTWLVQILMFLSLGLLVNPHELTNVIVPGVALGLFLIVIGRPLAVFLCLLPFKGYSMQGRLYIAWVGLRGAVPIIFATYALMSAEVADARFMFNVVFFVTILSLLLQGMTVNRMAGWLGLREPIKESAFSGINFPEEIDATMTELELTAQHLSDGQTLKEIYLPEGTLAVIAKRGDEYIIPNGETILHIGDVLLLVNKHHSL